MHLPFYRVEIPGEGKRDRSVEGIFKGRGGWSCCCARHGSMTTPNVMRGYSGLVLKVYSNKKKTVKWTKISCTPCTERCTIYLKQEIRSATLYIHSLAKLHYAMFNHILLPMRYYYCCHYDCKYFQQLSSCSDAVGLSFFYSFFPSSLHLIR